LFPQRPKTSTTPRGSLAPLLRRLTGVHRPRFRRRTVALVAGLVLALAFAAPAAPASDPSPTLDSNRVLASLNGALAWYQQARVAMQSIDASAGFADLREDQQTVVAILQRAFDTAQAQAAALVVEPSAAVESGSDRDDDPIKLETAIKHDEQEVARLGAQAKTASAARWPALARQLAAASNQLELDRARAEFVGQLKQLDDVAPATQSDLTRQIQTLQEGVPELRSANASATAPLPAAHAEPVVGTWPLAHRVVSLAHTRSTLAALSEATAARARVVATDLELTQGQLRPLFTRLHALAKSPGAGGDLDADEREFRDGLERGKRLAAAVLPARQEAALLKRFGDDLGEWRRAVDGQVDQTLRGLAIELLHVVIAVVVILLGALLWRIVVARYVADAYRRHLLLTAGNVGAAAAVVLVIAFHFTTELATLVTALGFAAAGVAFALQTIILALAGYFAIMGPNGIRVGDRVSLQGPFAYVQGEVADIGFLRIKLRELAGDPPQPTGRVVVFPNSVVFTGSFFKHPQPAAA
jgi:hypothetical protein